MTRITNFGRKRKYLEAGFQVDQAMRSNEHQTGPSGISVVDADHGTSDSVHPTKKRKKQRHPHQQNADDNNPGKGGSSSYRARKKLKTTKSIAGPKSATISGYKKRTEQRRLKRITDRQAETVCFACREKGHAAKDCPGATVEGQTSAKAPVGMCYRCGSTTHSLSRCKEPEDPINRFPFASCFICLGKGHLASSCPQNKEKGVYPNGGSCKLCGENTHLAKDCELRKKDASGTAATSIFGIGSGAGADEDDFHIFKRKNAAVSKDEKQGRRRKQLDAKEGLRPVTEVEELDKERVPSRPKKVVIF